MSSHELMCAEWVRKLAKRSLDFPSQCLTEPVLGWGVSITPLLTLHCTDLRAGGRVMADGGSCCQLLTTGLVAVDAQLRFQRLPLWSANSAPWTVRDGAGRKPVPSDDRASPGRAGPPTGAEAQLGCDDISILLLASKDRGAADIQDLARDRRRAAMGIHCAMPAEERRGWVRQRWRRVLEVQKQLHAADYALFLLAGRYRMDTHAPADTSARKQQHGRRAAPPNHRAHPPPRGSTNLSVHPLLQHAQHARNFRQQYRSHPTTSTFHTSAGGPSSAQAAPTNAAPPSSQASLLSPSCKPRLAPNPWQHLGKPRAAAKAGARSMDSSLL